MWKVVCQMFVRVWHTLCKPKCHIPYKRTGHDCQPLETSHIDSNDRLPFCNLQTQGSHHGIRDVPLDIMGVGERILEKKVLSLILREKKSMFSNLLEQKCLFPNPWNYFTYTKSKNRKMTQWKKYLLRHALWKKYLSMRNLEKKCCARANSLTHPPWYVMGHP